MIRYPATSTSKPRRVQSKALGIIVPDMLTRADEVIE
jgi:hypothetical protein